MDTENESAEFDGETILTVEHDEEHPYTMVRRTTICDDRLSFKARGILIYLVSKPKKWKVRVKDLQNNSTDGEHSVRSGLQELRKYGYIRTHIIRGDGGRAMGRATLVREIPHEEEQRSISTEMAETAISVNGHRNGGFPNFGKSPIGKTDAIECKENVESKEKLVSTEPPRSAAPQSTTNGFHLFDDEKPKPKIYSQEIAELLHFHLLAKGKAPRIVNIKEWTQTFLHFLTDSGFGKERIDKVLRWYVLHIGEHDRMPWAYCAKSFCTKFLAIEGQMQMCCKKENPPDPYANLRKEIENGTLHKR